MMGADELQPGAAPVPPPERAVGALGRRSRANRLKQAAAPVPAPAPPVGEPVADEAAAKQEPESVREVERDKPTSVDETPVPVSRADPPAQNVETPASDAEAIVVESTRRAEAVVENPSTDERPASPAVLESDPTELGVAPELPVVPAAPAPELDELPQDAADEAGYDPKESFWSVGKTQRTTYVPPALAAKFKQMQQTGATAEVIVLNAVVEAAERLPELIRAARGPVHEGGMFPGLKVIGPKGKSARAVRRAQDNSARIQFGLQPAYQQTLMELARKNNLKGSVLVRLALGAYFDVPVRLGRS